MAHTELAGLLVNVILWRIFENQKLYYGCWHGLVVFQFVSYYGRGPSPIADLVIYNIISVFEIVQIADLVLSIFCLFTRQNVVYARMLTYNDEEPWPQNLGAVAIAN